MSGASRRLHSACAEAEHDGAGAARVPLHPPHPALQLPHPPPGPLRHAARSRRRRAEPHQGLLRQRASTRLPLCDAVGGWKAGAELGFGIRCSRVRHGSAGALLRSALSAVAWVCRSHTSSESPVRPPESQVTAARDCTAAATAAARSPVCRDEAVIAGGEDIPAVVAPQHVSYPVSVQIQHGHVPRPAAGLTSRQTADGLAKDLMRGTSSETDSRDDFVAGMFI